MEFTIPDFDQSIKEIINPATGDPLVLSTKGARYSTSISIRQPLPTDGTLSLNGFLNRTSDELFSYTPGQKNYYSRLFLRFEQPILQPNEDVVRRRVVTPRYQQLIHLPTLTRHPKTPDLRGNLLGAAGAVSVSDHDGRRKLTKNGVRSRIIPNFLRNRQNG